MMFAAELPHRWAMIAKPGLAFSERIMPDFPYYDGSPVRISAVQWAIVLGLLAAGFAALIAPWPFLTEGGIASFLPALIFCGLPLVGLRIVAPRHWNALTRKVGGRDVLWMLGFGVLNIIVSVAIGGLLSRLFDFTPNPVVSGLSHLSHLAMELTLLRTLPQLFGEELLTILPFLAVLQFGHAKLGLARTHAIVLAWIVSALVFGAAHLPTYGWNFVQSLGIIGIARLVLTLAYWKTKNIWVSFGAHVVADWSYFGASVALTGLAAG